MFDQSLFSDDMIISPLHWRGTPGMLQARGREIARVRLTGILKGTLPVAIRQRQSFPLAMRELSELQQSEVGEVPLLLLLVTKLMHGVNVVIMEGVQGVVICPETGEIAIVVAKIATTRIRNRRSIEMSGCCMSMKWKRW